MVLRSKVSHQQQKENLPVPQCHVIILRCCNGIGGNGVGILIHNLKNTKMKTTIAKNEIKFIDRQFSVNPDYTQERTGNYELRNKIADKWENYPKRVDGCGNVCSYFHFDVKNQSFMFAKNFLSNENYIPMYRMISPALLLYRLIATFFGSPKCEDNYKSIWEYNLLHKATGKSVSFSEWKGAIGFWLPDTNVEKVNKQLKADIIELMNYLVSNECTHPYDNLVAGSIA